MKKIIALLLVAVMAIGFCACAAKTETPAEPAATEETTTTEPAATEEKTEEPAAEETETTENQHFDKLTLEFVPSKDADVIITGTKNLPELVQAEMSKLGYDIDEVDITVGTSYDATGEAMSAGSIDLGWLPGGTYALYSDDVDVILTATRNGLSNDSTNPADWPDLSVSEQRDTGTCRALKDQLAVLSDGTVVPCCLDHEGDVSLGNLFSQELDEILGSAPAQTLLSGFAARKLIQPLCRRCGYARRFR